VCWHDRLRDRSGNEHGGGDEHHRDDERDGGDEHGRDDKPNRESVTAAMNANAALRRR